MEEANQNEKRTLLEWCEDHPKTVFAIRFVLWTAFAAALPFAFIAWRYQIFTPQTKMQLTGWGFIAILILIIFVITLIRYVYKGLRPGVFKQCIAGFTKVVLPLCILLLLVHSIESTIHLFKQALGCVILCETAALPFNPFPTWLEKRRKEDKTIEAESVADVFWDKFFKMKKGE